MFVRKPHSCRTLFVDYCENYVYILSEILIRRQSSPLLHEKGTSHLHVFIEVCLNHEKNGTKNVINFKVINSTNK